MSHRRALGWILLLMAGAALLDGQPQAADVRLVAGLAVNCLGFLWYCRDRDARGGRKSAWLSVGMALFTSAVMPYYLLRSRADGERLGALMLYAADLALVALAVWMGVAIRLGLAWAA